MLTFANLGCKLYCAMVPSPHHGTGTMSPTGDGDTGQLKMGGGDMHVQAATVLLWIWLRSQGVYAKPYLQCPSACQYSPAWRQQLSAIELGPEVIKGLLYRVPQKYRPKVNGFRSHPVHVFLHFGTFCPVVLLIIASKLYCIYITNNTLNLCI